MMRKQKSFVHSYSHLYTLFVQFDNFPTIGRHSFNVIDMESILCSLRLSLHW